MKRPSLTALRKSLRAMGYTPGYIEAHVEKAERQRRTHGETLDAATEVFLREASALVDGKGAVRDVVATHSNEELLCAAEDVRRYAVAILGPPYDPAAVEAVVTLAMWDAERLRIVCEWTRRARDARTRQEAADAGVRLGAVLQECVRLAALGRAGRQRTGQDRGRKTQGKRAQRRAQIIRDLARGRRVRGKALEDVIRNAWPAEEGEPPGARTIRSALT